MRQTQLCLARVCWATINIFYGKLFPEFEAWADGMILERGTDMPTQGGGHRQVVDAWADGMILYR